MSRSLPALLLASSLLSASGVARANMAAINRDPSVIAGPSLVQATNLRVEREQLSFVCSENQGVPVCEFEARYAVQNPEGTREEAAVAFFGVRTRNAAVTIDGARVVATPPSAENLEALTKAVAARQHGAARAEMAERLRSGKVDLLGFNLMAEPGRLHEIVVTGSMWPGHRTHGEGYSSAAVVARHLLLSTKRSGGPVYDLEYLIAPIQTWKGDPRIDVRVSYPSRWELSIGGSGSPGWTRAKNGDSTVMTRSIVARDAPVLTMEIEPPTSSFRNGGPLLGIGGTLGTYKGVRGRIGYEVAAPSWLLYSLTADTDFRRRLILTPLVEAASPAVIILPSFGLGVGVPVQVAPDPRVGVRAQADLHFYPVGFVTSVDIYPRLGSLPGFTEVSLLGQVGF